MGKRHDWLHSPFYKYAKPDVPLLLNAPVIRGQYPTLNKVGDHMSIPAGDVLSLAGMAFLASFESKQDMLDALWEAAHLYAVKGKPLKLKFELEWPDSVMGRRLSKKQAAPP